METLITYFIKVSVLVSLFYLSYHFLLKRETFFSKNRLFLLLGLVTSVVLPLVTITKTVWIEPVRPVVFEEPFILPDFSDDVVINTTSEAPKTEINWIFIVAGFYVLGMLFFLVKFILSSLSLYKILHKNPFQKQNGFRFIDSKNVKTPFSFFNYIAFDSSSFSEEELQNIITHEKVHSKQKHSFDIALSEIFSVVFWLNPFVWLYKKAIQQNLEFIADNKAIKSSKNKVNYQKTLLKVTLNPKELTLANSFYQPLIKKRIIMLNKNQSKNRNLLKYAFILPVLVVFVTQFQTKVVAQTKQPTTKEIVYQGKPGESALIKADTIVWVKDFAKNPDEYVNQSTGEKIIVKGGSWEDVKEHLKPQPENKILGQNPLYIINGREISYDVLEKLNIETLEFDGEVAITQYSKEEALKKFGEKANDGAVVIQAKNVNLKMESSVKSSDKKDLVSLLKSTKDYNKIEVFNRWGNLVYTLKSNEKLDEEKIKSLPSGTYYYLIEIYNQESQKGYAFVEETPQNTKSTNSISDFTKQINENEYLEIYDRWGTIVYKPLLNEKFSRSQLSELPIGTYFYVQKDKTGYFYISEKDSKVSLSTNDEKRAKGKEIEQKLRAKFRENLLNEKEEFLRQKEKELKEREAQEKSGLSDKEIQKRFENRQEKLKEREKKLEERKKIVEERRKELEEKRNEKISEYKIDLDGSFSIIGKDSSDSNIESIKSKLEKMGIQMKVSNLKRNKNGEIIKIKISLSESSGTKNNKKEAKAEATFERENQAIPNIYVGKQNGSLIVSSSIVVKS